MYPTNGRPIRVCFMIDRLSDGGTEDQLLCLIHHLDRSEIEPHLVVLDKDDQRSRALESHGVPLLRLGVDGLLRPRSLAKARRLARFFRHERIDIVQVHFPDSTYFGVLVARLSGVPRLVGTQFNTGHWIKRWDRWLLRIYQRLIIDATVTNCEACRESVIKHQGAHPESVVVIENGIDAGRFLECNSAEGQKTAGRGVSRRVGIVAGLRPGKNVDLFLQAAKLIAEEIPGVHFEVAGDGPLRRQLQSLTDELGLRDQVTFHGNVVQVPELLSTLDVAVLCSSAEGLANSLLEYMAAGRPIVATQVGGNAELIQDEVTGLLTPPGDAAALARAILRLLSDRGLARRLGTAAQRRARQHNSHQVKAWRYQQFYRGLLDEGTDEHTVRRGVVKT